MATEDDVPQNQSALEEEVEKKDRELLTANSGMAIDKLSQVEEKKVEALTEEPHATMKTNAEVETTEEFIAGNTGPRDGENFLESPMLFEIAGEENSSSSQVYNRKDTKNEANRKKILIAEEHLQYQEVEVTIKEASLPGTQPNAEEESRDLNIDEARCIAQEETIMNVLEATSAQSTEVKDHLPDSTWVINVDNTAKLLVTGNQGAGHMNTFNTSIASFEDLHEACPPIIKDLAISSILESKRMEPQGLNSSPNVDDETTEEAQRSSDHARYFPSGIECKSDHTEVAKENSQDVEVLPHSVKVEDEYQQSAFLRNVSTKTECGSGHSEATDKNSQDDEMMPLSAIVGHGTAKEVETLSEHTGNVSIEIECGNEHGETTKGNPQDAEKLLHSVNMEDEPTKKVEISSDLGENVSIEIKNGINDCEVIEGTTENPKILPHSVILEDETKWKVESLLGHTRTVSIETERGSDPGKVTKENIQDAEIIFHSVEVKDEKIEKEECMSGLARNLSVETEGGRNYIEATKEEIFENIEILPGNSFITPSMTGTSTLEAEQCKTSREIKSTDDGKEKENLESKRSDFGGENVSVSSGADCPNKHGKEDVENGCHVEQVNSPLVNAFTEEVLLKDVGPEKVLELEAHTGTIFEKEDGDMEDTFYNEPAPVKEVSDMEPVVAKENQSEVGKQDKFLKEVATDKSTENAMVKAEERPESSSNESLRKKVETLEKVSQEQILVELLAGEDGEDEVSKGLTEANIDAEVLVKPEIFNAEKYLEALLPKNEPGKGNQNESLQAASMPLEKIDSSQHSERRSSVQEQRSIECFQGGLREENDSTSNASKGNAEDSLHENIMIDGSDKEVDSAVLNDTAQETYETGQCPESITLEELSTVEESSLELRSTTETEGDKYEKNHLIDIEDKKTQEKDEFPSGKEENFAPQSCADNKRKLVEDLSVGENKTECPKRDADYINNYEEVRGNDSELKQAQKDTFSKDEERETQTIAKEHIDTENSVESSAAEKDKSNHKAADPEADVHKGEAIYSNDDKEIKRRGSDEGAPELKEDQIAAKEAHMDTLCKDEGKEAQTIDVVKEYLVESSVAEENESHHTVKIEATIPEDGNKGEAFYSNDNEEIKDHASEEGAPEVKEDHTVPEEAYKDTCSKDEEKEAQIIDKEEVDTEYLAESSVAGKNKSDHRVKTKATNPEADDVHKGESVYSNDEKEIKGNDSAEGALEDQMLAAESHKDTFSKDGRGETQKIVKEEAAVEYSVESSVAEKNKSDYEITTKETNPEPDELHEGKGDHHNDDSQIKGNDSEEGAPELKEDRFVAEEVYRDTVKEVEEKEMQIIDKGELTTEYLVQASVAGKNKSDHEVKIEEPNHEADHKGEAVYRNDDEEIKGNDSVEGALELKEDQIPAEQADRDVFRKNDKKETQIMDKEEATTESVDSSITEENKSDHKITSEPTNIEGDEVHQGKADHLNYNKEIESNYSEEVAPKPKEYRIAAEEVHKDAFSKDEEKEKQIIDKQEVAAEYLAEYSVTEENKSHHKLKKNPVKPEADDVHKREAFSGNDVEDIKGIHSEEGAPELKEDWIIAIVAGEGHKDTFSEDEEKGPQKIGKELAATEYLPDSSVAEENKSNHEVTAEVINPEADELHKGKADHHDEEIKGNDSEEGATGPKEDQILTEEYKDTFSKDDGKEAQVIEKEEAAAEYSVESSVAEEKESDHEITTKETNPEANELHNKIGDHLSDDEEIKGNDSEEESPEPNEDQIAAEEVHKEMFSKDKEKEKQIIDKEEMATEYLEQFSVAEENKSDHEVTTKEMNPEADNVHKGKAVYRNDDENIKGNDSEEGAPELKDQVLAEEACKDNFSMDEEKEAQMIDKGLDATEYLGEPEPKKDQIAAEEACKDNFSKDEEKEAQIIDKGLDTTEYLGEPEPKEDQIAAEEVHKEMFSKDEEREMQIIDKEEMATEYLEQFSVAEEKKSDHEVMTKEMNPEADDVHKGKAVYRNNDENIKGNYSEEGAPELKDLILAEEVCKDNFSKDEEKKAQIIDKGLDTTECLGEPEPKEDQIAAEEACKHNFSMDEEKEAQIIDKGLDTTESLGEPEPKEDQIAAEEAHKEMFSKDEEKEMQIIDKEEMATEYLEQFSVAEENKSDHEVTTKEMNPDADNVHKRKAVYRNNDENIKGNDSEEGAPELKDQILAEEACKDTFSADEENDAQIIDKGLATTEYLGEPEPEEDQLAAEEVHKEMFSKDREKEMQIIDKEEMAAEYLKQFSVAEENKSDYEVTAKAMNRKAHDVHKGQAVYRDDDENIKGNDSEAGATELKDQILAEESCKDTFSKEEEKDAQIVDKGPATTEYLGESSVAKENKSRREITTEVTDSEGDELHKGTADLLNDGEIEGNDQEEVAQELKADQIVAEEIMQVVHKDIFRKDAEKEMEIIEKDEVATEYLLESYVAEANKSNHKVTTEARNPEAGDVCKQEAAYRTDDEEIKVVDSEEGAPEKKDQILAEEACKDKQKDARIIEKEDVAIEYLLESSVAEENKSNHMVKEEATNPEADELHKGKADHPNDNEVIEGQIAEPNEDQITEEVYKGTSSKDVEKETQIIDKEKVVAECLVKSSVAETEKSYHKVVIEATIQEAGDIHNSAEEMKAEDSSEENQKGELDREGIPQRHDIEKQIAKETNSSNDCYTTSPKEEIVQESFQEDEANKQKSADTQMNKEEILNLAIPISMHGERSVEGSLKKEESDVMKPEKEIKAVDIEGRTQNDKATYTAQEGKKVIANHEGNADVAGDTAGTIRLPEGLTPKEYQEQAENSSAVPEISQKSKENMLDTIKPAEIRSVGGLKKEEQDVLEPRKNEEGEMETAKHEGNADVSGDTASTIGLAEGLHPREYQEQAGNSNAAPETSEQSKEEMSDTKVSIEIRSVEGRLKEEEWDVMEPEKETKYLDREGTKHNDEATLSAQEAEKEMVKLEGNPDAAGTIGLRETLPPREYQELPENSSAVRDISEETNEKMLGTTESTEIRPVEGTSKQEEQVVMEQETEIKYLHIEGKTQNNEATHIAQEGQNEKFKHEGNPDAAGTNRLTEGLPSIEYQELAENSAAMPDISEERNEIMLDTMDSKEIKLVEGSYKQEEGDVMEPEKKTIYLDREGKTQKDEAILSAKDNEKDTIKHEGNPDAAGTNGLTEELPAREYQEVAESSSAVPDISKERKEKMLDTSTKISLVEGSTKQEEWDVIMEPQKETKDLHEEGTTQNNEATHSAKEGEKEMVKNEGNANAAGTHRLTEELLPREHQELAENSCAVPEISENSKEKMLDNIESTDITCVEESSKQNEWDVMKLEKETKDLDKEGTTQKDKAALSAQEGGNRTVKYEGIPDVAVKDRLTEGLPPREYQELAENSTMGLDISEERNEIMLDTTELTEIKAVEGSSKQEERDVMEPEKATRDLDREAAVQNVEAKLSAREGEKEMVKHERNPDAAGADRLTEGLPPKEYQELAENSSAVPDTSEERNEMMLDTTCSKEIKLVEGSSKQEEWDVMKPEKETKDFDREGTSQKDEATLSAEDGEMETVKYKGNLQASGTNGLTEGLPPREYKEPVEKSSAVPDISEERKEKMLDTKEPIEIINPVEGICKQEERDIMKPEKEAKVLQIEGSTIQNEEATYSAREVEKKITKQERNANVAGVDRPAEELPPREYQELSENSRTVPEISEKGKEKMLDTMESTEIRPVEGSLKQEELDVIEPENKTKDLDREGTTDNDGATRSAQKCDKQMVRQEGNPNVAGNDRLTEVLPPIENRELVESSSVVPDISEGGNEKMLDITGSTEIRPTEGSLKEDEWDVLEQGKKTKDVCIEGTEMNDEAMHSAQEGETNIVEHEANADVEVDTAGTVRMAERLPQREYKKVAENSSAMPEVSEKSKEKMLDNTEPAEIADRKEVKLRENMQLDNDTPTPDKVDQEDALKPDVQPRSKTVEISEFIKISSGSTKAREQDVPREDKTIGEPCQDSVLEEKDAKNIKEKNIISELREENGNSHSRNMNTEVKILNENVDSSKLQLPPEIDEESHAQENTVNKDSEVNSTSTSAAPLLDNITAGEFMVSEDRPVQAVNETNEDHKNNEDVVKVDKNTLSFLKHETPHYSSNVSTWNIGKDKKVINLEKQWDNAEKAGILLTGTSEHEQVNTMEKTKQNCLIIETESTQEVKAEAQGRSSEEEEKQQMVEEQLQSSTRTKKLYKNDIPARKGENEDRTFHNEDENYGNQRLVLEPTIKELQVEKEELQNAFAFFVVPEARGLKHAAEDVKSIDEHKETPESKVKEVPKREILAKAEARAIQDPFNDSYMETMSALEIQRKKDHKTNTGTKPSSGDEKLQLLQQGPVDKNFQPSIELLESDGSNAVEEAKGDEHLENLKIIEDCQSTVEKHGSTTLAESSQSDLQQPTTEPEQQEDVRETQDQHQSLHGLSGINGSALVIDMKDDPFCAASAKDASFPLEMEKLETVPFSQLEQSTPEDADTNNSSTDSKNILQLQQEAIMESFEAVGDNLEPSEVKSEEATHWEEKATNEEATLASMPREACSASLSDLLRASKKDISQVTTDFTEETEPNVQKEEMKDFKKEMAEHEEPKTDEAYDSPVTVEGPSDIDIKAAHKKTHNILSGVGSKVKHSIAKVKKAIIGKSSHPKPPSPK